VTIEGIDAEDDMHKRRNWYRLAGALGELQRQDGVPAKAACKLQLGTGCRRFNVCSSSPT
jgi:hypothetical protein